MRSDSLLRLGRYINHLLILTYFWYKDGNDVHDTYGAASVTATDTRRTRSLRASDCSRVVVDDRMSRWRAITLRELPT